jgi:hypothetical protein
VAVAGVALDEAGLDERAERAPKRLASQAEPVLERHEPAAARAVELRQDRDAPAVVEERDKR